MKKLTRGFSNVAFLLKPQLKYGWLIQIFNLLREAVLSPIADIAVVTVAEAVISAVQAGKTFREVLFAAGIRLAICFGATLIGWIGVDFYERWKHNAVEGEIERMIYRQALNIDLKEMDDPKFFDAYKLATEEFVAKSSNAVYMVSWFIGSLASIGVMAAVLASSSLLLVAIVVVTTGLNMATQIYWNAKSGERSKNAVKPRRKQDYMRRLLFNTGVAADLRATDVTAPLMSMFSSAIADRIANAKKYMSREFAVDIFQSLLGSSTTFIIVIYVAWGLMNGRIADIGVFATMLAAAQTLSGRLQNLSYVFTQLNEASVYAEQVRSFFDIKSEIEPLTTGAEPPEGAFSVELRNVSFAYPNSEFALKDISLKIPPNAKIAIVGENGAGKTTLSKLLLRLYDIDSGEIFFNNTEIKSYNPHKLRRKIGVAFQTPNMYALTVSGNMQVYNTADADVLQAALDALKLDKALDAEVTREFDENGVMFSGGEAQKLALARLLTGDFGLLLLDEPSSALDPLAEYEMTKLIFEKSRTTAIMVAHRLSTIRHADRIYLIANGSVAEQGTHEELLALKGKYYEMFTKQAENYVK
ncbi:MAG: ABC transporter ATP-binding protein/permease [Oscillospiraceae bacterium]|jgi:ATP-binding cassette subfamily B protein|nr:ABC transporter ATP-binding protein/permease [Oscillospiraceae bacterium]